MTAPALAALAALAVLLAPAPAVAQSICGLATLQQVRDILPICCGSTAAPDCSAGFPPRCAPECAELLVPFWESCSTLMQFMGSDGLGVDVHAVSDFIEPCEQSMALVRGAESCDPAAGGTGRGGDGDLHSWVDDVQDACCTQNGINVCRGDGAVPWLCNADCALTFIPFMETCMLQDGVVPPPPPPGTDDAMAGFLTLYNTCQNMNSAAPAEVASLIHDVNEMVDNDHCIIDTSGIVSADITYDNSRPVDQRQGGQDVVCVDDDVFVQQAFGNDGVTCAAAAATGLCPTLEVSGIADRCCISCSDGHRRAEELFPADFQSWDRVHTCPIDQLSLRARHASQTCCQGEACAGGIPHQCSFNCTRAFVPFVTDCHDVLAPILGDDIQKYESFSNLCTNLNVHSLVMALHTSHCWYCGDGQQDPDEECDGGDPTDDCASSPCLNGATCHDETRSYQCQCANGWTGDNCEQTVDPIYQCHADYGEADCDGHATCRHTGPGTHECTCFLHYTGDGFTCAEQGIAQCLPDCTRQVVCPALPPLEGATISYSNGMISPSVATYTCDGGDPPSDGDATRTCQEDGSWSGVAPTQCRWCHENDNYATRTPTDAVAGQGISGVRYKSCERADASVVTIRWPVITFDRSQTSASVPGNLGSGEVTVHAGSGNVNGVGACRNICQSLACTYNDVTHQRGLSYPSDAPHSSGRCTYFRDGGSAWTDYTEWQCSNPMEYCQCSC